MFKLSDIRPNPKNPRFIKDAKFEKLVKSIVFLPQMMALRPIVVDENNIALGGNMRDRAVIEIAKRGKEWVLSLLNESGKSDLMSHFEPIFNGLFPEGWVKKSNDLTEDQKREFIIKDNASFGEWDMDELANNWDEEELKDWGLDLKFKHDDFDDEEPEELTFTPTFKFEVECRTKGDRKKLMAELIGRGYSVTDDY